MPAAKNKAEKGGSLDTKPRSQDKAILFINHYTIGETQGVDRPDRKTISSHVQKVIRQTKLVDASIRLKPAACGGISSDCHAGRTRGDQGRLLRGRWTLHWKEGYNTACSVTSPKPSISGDSMIDDMRKERSLGRFEGKVASGLEIPILSADQTVRPAPDMLEDFLRSTTASVAFGCCECCLVWIRTPLTKTY